MPNTQLLHTITHFLEQSPYTSLEITFAEHQIINHLNWQYLNTVYKTQSRVMIHKVPQSGLAQMVVVDNLLFNFSFHFLKPDNTTYYQGPMLQLPRPLSEGKLQITTDSLRLSFIIDAPDPALSVQVEQYFEGEYQTERFKAFSSRRSS